MTNADAETLAIFSYGGDILALLVSLVWLHYGSWLDSIPKWFLVFTVTWVSVMAIGALIIYA